LITKTPHPFFEKKNYSVTTCNNGRDAIDMFENENFDIVFLDENMPGMMAGNPVGNEREKKSASP
jgi:CheY-like chemotaxis protein